MTTGWRYRVAGAAGTATLALAAVAIASHVRVQTLFRLFPLVGHLPFERPGGHQPVYEAATAATIVAVALLPLYEPRARRLLDVAALAVRRTALALVALAAIGYFDYTHRLPRATLLVAGGLLLVAVPLWFVAIRPRPSGNDRAVIVGDDPAAMAAAVDACDAPIVGYVSSRPRGAPPTAGAVSGSGTRPATAGDASTAAGDSPSEVADGGRREPAPLRHLERLGHVDSLDRILVEHDVDTAVLAFARLDRRAFFGTLDVCDRAGVRALVHRDHADAVMTRGHSATGDLVTVDVEPWSLQTRLVKRGFDVAFAAAGLLAFAPVMAAVALAVRSEDGGPVFYAQERTAEFGDTVTVWKFRSMRAGAADDRPGTDPEQVTRVGRLLRRTHLDELPQLWTILVGEMSVVGPRAAWTAEERRLEDAVGDWRKRWFVKPGLTGLAQINGVESTAPAEKLRYDVEYVRRQSPWFDLKIVVRQLWLVVGDVLLVLRDR